MEGNDFFRKSGNCLCGAVSLLLCHVLNSVQKKCVVQKKMESSPVFSSLGCKNESVLIIVSPGGLGE